MKSIRFAIIAVVIMCFGLTSGYAQNSLYQFAGNLRSYHKKENTVTFSLTNGAVKIAHLKDVGFRIRYSFTGKFAPLFSYATVKDLPAETPISVINHRRDVILKAGDEILTIQKSPFRITYSSASGYTFMKDSFGAGHQGDKICHIVKRYKGTVYYGLGERPDRLNRAGQRFMLWNTDHGGYNWGTEPLYQSYPFYIGLDNDKAYGVFYDNSFKTMFDFGGQLKTHIGYYADGGELRYYVFYGPNIKEVLKKYTRLTGRAPLPPKWALGYQQSRYSYYPENELYRLEEQFRSRKIPCDVFYMDIDYMHGYRDFTFNKKFFPHPDQMFANLKKDGIKVVTIIDPGIKKDSTYWVYNEGLKKNLYVKYPDGSNYVGQVWPGKTTFPDFSNPKARAWWGDLINQWEDKGISGVWLDMNEPSVFGGKTMPYIAEFDKDGRKASEYEMHNEYGLLEAKATYDGILKKHPNKRPFILTRAGFSGTQRYAAMWTGDNVASWQDVAMTMPMVMGTSLAGESFDGFDIGGFIGSPTGELYMRFLQIGVLMPFCRTHSAKGTVSQEPWDYGHMYTYINKKLIQFRYKLLPYLYTAFYENHLSGAPIVRPLVWQYQDDPKTYNINDQFMLGDHLLSAPVIKQGMNTRTLYLPKGTWYEFFNDKKYEGGKKITVDAPIRAIDTYNKEYRNPYAGLPLFVQAGSVIPMQPVQQYVGQKKITNITLQIYAGASSDSYLYEDDGKTQAYRKGDFRLTTFQTDSTENSLNVDISMNGHYDSPVISFTAEVHGLSKSPKNVEVNGKNIQSTYNAQTHILTFKLTAKPQQVSILK